MHQSDCSNDNFAIRRDGDVNSIDRFERRNNRYHDRLTSFTQVQGISCSRIAEPTRVHHVYHA